jgi:hypothetical protein
MPARPGIIAAMKEIAGQQQVKLPPLDQWRGRRAGFAVNDGRQDFPASLIGRHTMAAST